MSDLASPARRGKNRRKLLLVALADPTTPLVVVLNRLGISPREVARWLRSSAFSRDVELLRRRLVQLATLEVARGAFCAATRMHESTGQAGDKFTDANLKACEGLQKIAGLPDAVKPPARRRGPAATTAPAPQQWADPDDLRRTRQPVHPDAKNPKALLEQLEALRDEA
ncbi:MAG TPA: hypothetical protein VK324_14770 [Tepidisphaeraceae bacterium]|nr:hypothetical protein [Tepidisphaeraceae bacterium]